MPKFCLFEGNNSGLVRLALMQRGVWEEIPKENIETVLKSADFIWKPINLPIKHYWLWDKITQPSANPDYLLPILNHFQQNHVICTKTGLIRSLRNYYRSSKEATKNHYSLFETTPTSYILTPNIEDDEFRNFLSHFRSIKTMEPKSESLPLKQCTNNFWIVKPANQNQGKGIIIMNDLKEILNFLRSKPVSAPWIVQKYIERPLLYHGRKFDIRVWGLFTQETAFFYHQGYIRTSSDPYSLDNHENYVHLTNNCLQKHGSNYGLHEQGNTISFEDFGNYLNMNIPESKKMSLKSGNYFKELIIPRIRDLIIDVYLSAKPTMLDGNRRSKCFELLGFDFIIDEDYRTWLLEVNTNPYLGEANEYISRLLKEMINDLIEITLDKKYTPNETFLKEREGKPNGFEVLYNEKKGANLRKEFSFPLYPFGRPDSSDIKPELQRTAFENKKKMIEVKEKRRLLKKTETITPFHHELNNKVSELQSKIHLKPVPKPQLFPQIHQSTSEELAQKKKIQLEESKKQEKPSFEDWVQKKKIQLEQTKKQEKTKQINQEAQLIVENELWKSRVLAKLEMQKANKPKEKRKKRKKTKKRQKSLVYFNPGSLQYPEIKSSTGFFANKVESQEYRREKELIETLIDKYTNM